MKFTHEFHHSRYRTNVQHHHRGRRVRLAADRTGAEEDVEEDEDDYAWYYNNPQRYIHRPRDLRMRIHSRRRLNSHWVGGEEEEVPAATNRSLFSAYFHRHYGSAMSFSNKPDSDLTIFPLSDTAGANGDRFVGAVKGEQAASNEIFFISYAERRLEPTFIPSRGDEPNHYHALNRFSGSPSSTDHLSATPSTPSTVSTSSSKSFLMPLTPLDIFYTQSSQDDAPKHDGYGGFFGLHRTSPPRPNRSSEPSGRHQIPFFRVLST